MTRYVCMIYVARYICIEIGIVRFPIIVQVATIDTTDISCPPAGHISSAGGLLVVISAIDTSGMDYCNLL